MTVKLPYTENFNLMDGRLVICAIAVGVAMFALLWDFLNPFPKSRPVLIGCVASYFLLMGVLTLYTTFKVNSKHENNSEMFKISGKGHLCCCDAEGPSWVGS